MTVPNFVEAHVNARNLPVNNSEFTTHWLPRESMNRFLHFHAIYRNFLLSHMEDFEVVRHTLKY